MKSLTANSSANEVAAGLGTLPAWPWPDAAIRARPISGGLTNVAFRIEVDDCEQTMFVKIPGIGTEAFINRRDAHVAASRAAALGLGPSVLFFDPVSGIEVSEFLDGYRSCTEADVVQFDRTLEIMRLYRRFHATELLPNTKTILDMIDEHLDQIRTQRLFMPPLAVQVLRRYADIALRLRASGLDIVPAHNDMYPANFMIRDGHPMKLIDYDYASNNERSYEIGGILGTFAIPESRRRDLLDEYFGTASPQQIARVTVLGVVCDVKWGLWGCLNGAVRDVDFDYSRYGSEKLMNAERVMADQRWATWLSTI